MLTPTSCRWQIRGFTIFLLILLAVLIYLKPNFITQWLSNNDSSQASFEQDRAPGTTVENFYEWYLAYEGNPLTDRVYLETPFLTDEYKQEITKLVDSQALPADPFLCAQDKPESVNVGLVETGDQQVEAKVSLNYQGIIRPLEIDLVKQADQWRIHGISCGQAYNQAPLAPQTTVVYFQNTTKAPDETNCGLVYGAPRTITAASLEDKLKLSLQELFKGPIDKEQEAGFSSFFSEATQDALISVSIIDQTAYVNLRDIREAIPNASSSCGGQSLLAQIEETIKHSREVEQVVIAIEGEPQAFYDWIQIGCGPSNNFCSKTGF